MSIKYWGVYMLERTRNYYSFYSQNLSLNSCHSRYFGIERSIKSVKRKFVLIRS